MKKHTTLLALCLLGLSVTFCKKKKDDPAPTPVIQNGFTWSQDNGAVITADSAFWTAGTWGAGVRAYKNGYSSFFEINLDNSNVGNHTLDNSSTFLNASDTYSMTGTLVISGNANSKLSGSFDATVAGGSIKSVKGNFGNLSKR
ncbi:hypothetical protein [uncultured Cytophaga sp.]|uniref:hypothetical protein n=1 Tax=uncultured Cytophaga sp. TaxID=160238 RepID=UPI00261E313C|nr:hypothetical protein [uncultured Cytophaga sp.]